MINLLAIWLDYKNNVHIKVLFPSCSNYLLTHFQSITYDDQIIVNMTTAYQSDFFE